MPQPQPAVGLICGEVRGGNEPVWTVVDLPGLAGVLYSHPCHGESGGDVHYCSMCNSGIIARVCLADVAGHGERVAGVARVMHAELRASVNSWDEREVMRALDVRLEQSGLKAITTAALVSYRPWKQLLTISYAGHPPGWIYHAGGDGRGRRWERLVITEAVTTGPADLPLGTSFGPSYSRTQVRAVPGDRLLLVTDGVLEAPSPDDTEFGDAGVERVLDACLASGNACEGLATALVDALRAHTAADPMTHDDVSFYVAEITPPPPGPQVWQIVKNRILPALTGRG
ncbi:MAG: PP2C family protein-serine/threonine phosphatase [Vicinamibacteraceae bacterium]